MNLSASKPLHIILVEDDEVDAEAIERAFGALGVAVKTTRFADGRMAIDALRSAWGSQLQAEPHVILLDLNMPRMTGFEFLDWLRSRPGLLRSIVFVFTTSETASDCVQAYDRQVAGYLAKAQLGAGYRGLLPLLTAFCTSVCFPPPRKAAT